MYPLPLENLVPFLSQKEALERHIAESRRRSPSESSRFKTSSSNKPRACRSVRRRTHTSSANWKTLGGYWSGSRRHHPVKKRPDSRRASAVANLSTSIMSSTTAGGTEATSFTFSSFVTLLSLSTSNSRWVSSPPSCTTMRAPRERRECSRRTPRSEDTPPRRPRNIPHDDGAPATQPASNEDMRAAGERPGQDFSPPLSVTPPDTRETTRPPPPKCGGTRSGTLCAACASSECPSESPVPNRLLRFRVSLSCRNMLVAK